MASPLQLASYVQQQGEIGRQQGTRNRLAALASQAYGAPVQERRGLVQQAIGTDPTAGFALGQSLEQDRGQQMSSLSQKARMLVGYAKAGNQQGVQSLYPQLAAEAQQLGLGQGIPQQWDESYLPGIEQLAMMGGAAAGPAGLQEFQALTTGMSAEDVERARRIKLGLDPRAVTGAPKIGTVVGADGRTRQYIFSPEDRGFMVLDGNQWRPMGPQEMQQATQQQTGAPQGMESGATQFIGSDGQPVVVGDDIPDHVRQSILSDTPGWDAAAEARLPPRNMVPGGQAPAGSLAVGRSPEEQAAETEAARRAVGLQFAPAEAQAAANQARMVEEAKAAADRVAASTERTISADDALDLLNRAEELIPISTGSGIGALADRAAGFVGMSDPGGRAIDALKTIAGQLVAKMPRFEGPQSDRDVQLYMDMAGNLADPSIPRERRLAALQTVRELQARYASSPAARPASPAAPAPQRARNPQTGQVVELRNGQWVPVNE